MSLKLTEIPPPKAEPTYNISGLTQRQVWKLRLLLNACEDTELHEVWRLLASSPHDYPFTATNMRVKGMTSAGVGPFGVYGITVNLEPDPCY